MAFGVRRPNAQPRVGLFYNTNEEMFELFFWSQYSLYAS